MTPEQPDADPADLGPGQLERHAVDRLGHVGRLGQRPLPGDGAERRVADLDRHGPGPHPRRAQPRGDAVGHREQRPLDDLAVRACRRRRCARGRPTSPGRPSWTGSASMPRARVDQRRPVLAEPADDEVRRRAPARSPMVRTPYSARATPRCCSPTPHSREIGSGARKAASSPAGTTTSPSGLRRSEAILATSLVVATPTEAVSPTSSRTRVLDPSARSPGRRRTARASR